MSRQFLRSLGSVPITKGHRSRTVLHLSRLARHHSWNVLEIPRLAFRIAATMTWHCGQCSIQNPHDALKCRGCRKSWEEVWQPSRRRSQSARKAAKKEKEKADRAKPPKKTDSPVDAVFADQPPWIASTPQSRLQVRQVTEQAASSATATPVLPVPPPPPVVPPPETSGIRAQEALSADEIKTLDNLRNLRQLNVPFTGHLQALIEDLERREKAGQPVSISHSQLNRLNKLRSQVASTSTKIQTLDGEWATLFQIVQNRVQVHASQYKQCRQELIATLQTKQQELRQLKLDINQASLQLTTVQDEPQCKEETPDIEQQMQSLQSLAQQFAPQHVQLVDDDEDELPAPEEMEEEDMENDAEGDQPKRAAKTPIPFGPHTTFRGASSPLKVATTHLKTREEKEKDKAKGSKAKGAKEETHL